MATDIAARGLDIEELPHVVNYELPNVPEDYVHRIGRTGRAGSRGQALSLVSHDETGFMRDIERLLKVEVERVVIEGFEPSKNPPRSTETPGRREQRPQQQRHSRGNSQPQGRGRSGSGARSDGARSGGQQPARREGGRSRPAGSLIGGNR